MKKFLNLLEFLLFILIWIYVITKLFFFDIDVKIINHINPGLTPWLDYKFVFILLFIVILLVSIGTRNFILKLVKLLVFPFLLIFWYIPDVFYQRGFWGLLFAYFSRIFSFFFNQKRNLISLSLLVTSCFLLFKLNNKYLVLSGLLGIIALIIYHLYTRIRTLFLPSTINLSFLSEETKKKEISILGSVGVNFFISLMRKMGDSRRYFLYICLKMIFTFFYLTILFGVINYGLNKLMPADFSITVPVGFFDFIYYSFNAWFFQSIGYITPTGIYTRIISMCIPFTGVVIIVIFFGALFAFYGERAKK